MTKLTSRGLILLGLLLLTSTLVQYAYAFLQAPEAHTRRPGDLYDPSLARLNSLDKLMAFTDSLYENVSTALFDPARYAELADSVVRMRFYHGLQNYRFTDNYLANLSGKFLWSHLGAKVLPDDILKGHKAFCSQSSIVFQELLRRKDIEFRTVALPGHFCTEVLVDGHWRFYDVSYKPSFAGIGRLSAASMMEQPEFIRKAYLYSFQKKFFDNLDYHFDPERVSYGAINAFAAPRMAMFHHFTFFLSHYGGLVAMILGLVLQSATLIPGWLKAGRKAVPVSSASEEWQVEVA